MVGVAGLEPGSRGHGAPVPDRGIGPERLPGGSGVPRGSAGESVGARGPRGGRSRWRGGDDVDCTRDDCSVVVFGYVAPRGPDRVRRACAAPGDAGRRPRRGASGRHPHRRRPTSFRRDPRPPSPSADPTARLPSTAEPPTPGVSADPDGRASASLTVAAGRCPRGSTCAVAVVVDGGEPRAYAPLRIIGRSGVAYDDPRLRAGLGGRGAAGRDRAGAPAPHGLDPGRRRSLRRGGDPRETPSPTSPIPERRLVGPGQPAATPWHPWT